MHRLLYLDFDGVLHASTGKDLFCRMHLLEEALIGKDCQIIISSSWRFHHPFKYLQSLLPESLRGQVAGNSAVLIRNFSCSQDAPTTLYLSSPT